MAYIRDSLRLPHHAKILPTGNVFGGSTQQVTRRATVQSTQSISSSFFYAFFKEDYVFFFNINSHMMSKDISTVRVIYVYAVNIF
jgi:hypothetical protein